MYLKFTDRFQCAGAIKELNKRLGLNGSITSTYATPIIDADGAFIIPKPQDSILDKKDILVRDVLTESEEGKFKTMQIVDIKRDENENDITEYQGNEYMFEQRGHLSNMFQYQVVDSFTRPKSEDEI